MSLASKRGFTLIELLVVISIIGLLSSVVLSALNSARVKADVSQANQIADEYRKALMLYYSEYQGYPGTTQGVNKCLVDYPVVGTVNSRVCGAALASTGFYGINEDAITNAFAATYKLSEMKIVNYTVVSGGVPVPYLAKGPLYACTSSPVGGVCPTAFLRWRLPGNQSCIGGAAVTPPSSVLPDSTFCTLTLN